MLFLPAYTPEFSPIESMFGSLKNKLKAKKFSNKEELAREISEIAYNMSPREFEGFYRRSMGEMLELCKNDNTKALFPNVEFDNPE